MKLKYYIMLSSLILTGELISYYQAVSSKTYFTNIPLWEIGKPTKEIFVTFDRIEETGNCFGGVLEVGGYGGQTTNSKKLNSYFMPYNKCALYVIEGIPTFGGVIPADGTTPRDIEGRNFNIETTHSNGGQYEGVITFNPQQTTAGVGFTWRQTLFSNKEGIPTLWGEISFPVQFIRNKMNLCENVINNGGGVNPTPGLNGAEHVANMRDAFKQDTWLYGKVDDSVDHEKWGVADVELRLAYNSIRGECCDLNAYFGIVAPTGTKIDQCTAGYLFNAVIGNNHHFGALFGSHFGYDLASCGKHMLRMELDMSSKYLFSNEQWRSFDLVDKEWSRYIEVYSNVAQATTAFDEAPSALSVDSGTAGINVFTRRLRVTPRFATNINTALNYSYCHADFEFGYNLFTRQAERIEFPRECCFDFPLTIAVKDIDGSGATNIARNIKNDFPASSTVLADYAQNIIQVQDLDLDSAAHPALMSHTLYAGACYNCDMLRLPWFFGVAGMYEFSSMNSSLDRWNVVGKFGFSY